jgi:hypothetical protein
MFSPPFASAKAGGGFPFRNPSTTAILKCQRFEQDFQKYFFGKTQKCPTGLNPIGHRVIYLFHIGNV